MKKLVVIILFILLFLPTKQLNSWGFHAHKLINRYAVFTMPEELIGFFKKHINHLSERSEEHTSELQSQAYLVCRLLLEKKKKKKKKDNKIPSRK